MKKLEKLEVLKSKALPKKELEKLIGGKQSKSYGDSVDCNSELASGGGTTDSYEING